MNGEVLKVDRVTKLSLVTIAVCLLIRTLGDLLGGSAAIAQSNQRQVVDVVIKSVDPGVRWNLADPLKRLQVDCQLQGYNDIPLRVKIVDDDMTPRQPKE